MVTSSRLKVLIMTLLTLGQVSAATAGECDSYRSAESKNIDITEIEDVLYHGNFVEFFELTSELIPNSEDSIQQAIQSLTASYPSGFDSCRLILHENMSPILSKQATEFISNGLPRFFLYLVYYTDRDGSSMVASYHLTTDFSEIIDMWN